MRVSVSMSMSMWSNTIPLYYIPEVKTLCIHLRFQEDGIHALVAIPLIKNKNILDISYKTNIRQRWKEGGRLAKGFRA